MPTGAFYVVMALGAIGVVFVGKPVVKAAKYVGHGTCRIVTLGNRCKHQQITVQRVDCKSISTDGTINDNAVCYQGVEK